jgi:hypothetical protein
LHHLAKGRKQQILIVLDNADQRDEQTQQQVFLVAQEIAERWSAMVYVSLRPETFYRSKKFGALSGYHAKAFTISPPRIDLVVHRRLIFALKITSGEIPITTLHVGLQLKKLDSIIRSFISTLEGRPDIGEFLDNISGGNVRLALDLVKGFFGSGHVNTSKIIQIYDESKRYDVSIHEFLRAVIYGDAEHYNPAQSPLANVFDVLSIDPKEHFLTPLLIGTIDSLCATGTDGFVESTKIYERLQSMEFTPEQIDMAILRGCQRNLTEATARRIPQPGQEMPPAIRTTTVGLYHIRKLMGKFAYVDAMIIDTPIFDFALRPQIRNVQSIEDRLERFELFHHYLSNSWDRVKKSAYGYNWVASSIELQEDLLRIRSGIEKSKKKLA